MITRIYEIEYNSYRGLSTDNKPLEVPNGSEFLEMDTGKTYLFDAASEEWIAMKSGGGGASTWYGSYTMVFDFSESVGVTVTTGVVLDSENYTIYDDNGTEVAFPDEKFAISVCGYSCDSSGGFSPWLMRSFFLNSVWCVADVTFIGSGGTIGYDPGYIDPPEPYVTFFTDVELIPVNNGE